ncbi:MAG: PQQ-binding-like beta-propeller repeat protein, partial [Acidobacteria bacterium]|nr:PQQ-binding-like beta-propeller repeat protein [Acidobacteriota bacterium]
VTPIVVDGVMYVTAVNECHALDARNGKRLWTYQRPRTKGVIGDAGGGINRGAAVLGNRLFLVTDHAHLLALDRSSGELLWETEMADYRQNYGATSAPLVVGDLVLSGTSGGDEGVRGFLAAYHADTGKEAWRFWTVPLPGEPAASTWIGKGLEHGCTAAWLTGSYDPSTKLIFWATGNPCPDFNGDQRLGDNLYSDSVLALRPSDGSLAWHYQFTPHDLHDWDAQQTLMVVDATFAGRKRPLLVQANRNGFFYVLDRTNGELLLARPFVRKLTWASGIGSDGRPRLLPGAEPTEAGVRACPAIEGATNWMSTAFNPSTGLYYVMALEKCSIYRKEEEVWQAGKSFYGGGTKDPPEEPGRKFLRAIDITTGRIAWEYAQTGPGSSWGGLLSTAGGLVFLGDDNGEFTAVDAVTGKRLWAFQANQHWRASPMTYTAGGQQMVAIAGGPNILVFALPSP